MSKLAALAAKRRKKESEQVEPSEQKDDYTSALNKLTIQQRKPIEVVEEPIAEPEPEAAPEQEQEAETEEEQPVATRATPSPFANTILASSPPLSISDKLHLLKDTKGFDFSEPSPDDVIYQAQTGKKRT